MAFLVWTPWQKILTATTEYIRSNVGGRGEGWAVFGCTLSFGLAVTVTIAFLSSLVHSGHRSVVARIGHHLSRRRKSRRPNEHITSKGADGLSDNRKDSSSSSSDEEGEDGDEDEDLEAPI